MVKFWRRNPRGYDGTRTTTHSLGDLLPAVLKRVGDLSEQRPDLILAAWPEVIGPQLAPMTKAVSFEEGVLLVTVRTSTLYSLLTQHDKYRILKNLRKKFPKTQINNIRFRLN